MTQSELQEKFSSEGFSFFSKNRRGILDITQRVGKIRTTLLLLNKLGSNKILVTYPDNSIKQGWLDDMADTGFKGEIALCNYDSLHKYNKEYWDIAIVDECHLMYTTKSKVKLFEELLSNSQLCLGLTGTLASESRNELYFNFGLTTILKYTAEQAIADGIVADYKITVHQVPLDTKVLSKNSKGKYVSEKQKYDALTWVINKKKEKGESTSFLTINRNRISQNSIGKQNKVKELLEIYKDKRLLVFSGTSKQAESYGIPAYYASKKGSNFDDFLDGKINKLSLVGIGRIGKTYKGLEKLIIADLTGNEESTSQLVSRAMLLDFKGKVAEIDVICLNEKAEIKKLKESFSMLNNKKIEWK